MTPHALATATGSQTHTTTATPTQPPAPSSDPATTGFSSWWFLLAALLWSIGYVLHCVIWPFRACRTCHGSGRSLAPSGKAWRLCRACKGSPARLRFGRRIYDNLRTFKDQ